MKTKSVQDFFENEYVNQASYDNLRKIASCIDGLKNSSRKVICTTIDKNISENLKISQFSNKAAEYCEYLHGDLSPVVTNLAKDFSGTNNLPLLFKKGNFGTRLSNEASASRYIFARKSDNLDTLFVKDDNSILVEQYFEGSKIEPKFYVPSLPILLINGSEGISSGFAQKILTRDVKEIKKYLTYTLQGKEPKKFPLPSFNGFNGTVEQGETPNQFLIKGVLEKSKRNTILITELPIGYELMSYIKVLDDLEENKAIKSYKDLSDNQFLFEVNVDAQVYNLPVDKLLEHFKLVKKVSENYTSLDENNKIVEFDSPTQIMQRYISVKLEYMGKRKNSILGNLQSKIDANNTKYQFIKYVVEDKLVLNKRKRSEIEADMESLGLPKNENYDYLLKLPIISLTEEEMERLKTQTDKYLSELNTLQSTSEVEMFLKDISAVLM